MNPARFPWRLTRARGLEDAGPEQHLADLVRLLLLTSAGERLHRPDLGAGLGSAALFEPLDDTLVTAVQIRARGSLDRALGDRIEVLGIDVRRAGESTLEAAVAYRVRPAGSEQTVVVTLRGGAP